MDKLTAAVAAAEPAAVERFYRRYFDYLLRCARKSVGPDESLCLDVVHDAVLKILRTIRAVNSEARLLAWLKLVVQTTAYDATKSNRRRAAREYAFAAPNESAPSADTQAEQSERVAWLRTQLDAMDPKIVRMIELRFSQEWTLAKIGRLFGLSAGSVDGRLRRALVELQAKGIETFRDECE